MIPPTVDLAVRQEPDKVQHTIRRTIGFSLVALMCASPVPLCGAEARAASSATGPAGTPSTVGQLGRKDALEFEGNQTFPAEAIHRGFRLHIGYHLAAHPTAPLGAYLTTLQSMVLEGYRRGGFSNPQVNVTLSSDQNRILVRIQEGHRFKAGAVRFKGAPPMADSSVQEKLLNALAGLSFASQTNGMPTTNLSRATWTEGAYVPFNERAVDELKAAVAQELGTLNFYRPDLKLTIMPDVARQEADLVVEMLDEGLKGTIEDFSFTYPLREKKNTDEELMDFLGLKRGMSFQGSLLQDLTERLWDSGRFFRHEVTLEPLADIGKFKLIFKLEDLMNASPLRVPLTTNETVMLKLCRRLNELDRGPDDLVLAGAVDLPEDSGLGSFLAELVLSRSGLALLVRAPVVNGPPRVLYATVLSEQLGIYSGWRRQMLLFPDKMSIKAFASLLPEPEPRVEERYTLSLGAGFSSVTSNKAVDWTFRFAPSRFLEFAHDDEEQIKVEDGVLSARLDPKTGLPFDVKIDAETGRLLQASVVVKTNGASVNLQLRFEEEGFARVSAEIAKATADFQNQHQPEFPLSSLLGFCATDLLESGILESPFLIEKFFEDKRPEERLAWEKSLPNLRSTVAKVKAALGKKDLAECLSGFEALYNQAVKAQDESSAVDDRDSFTIPMSLDPALPSMQHLFGIIGAWVVSESDVIWPRGTWPWVLTRETGFTLANQGKYTSVELQKLLTSEEMGPLGSWAAASLLARVNAPLSERFVRRSLEQLSPEGMRRDLEIVLDPSVVAGRVSSNALALFSRLKSADLEAMTQLVKPATGRFLTEIAESLREGSNRPPVEAFWPILTKHWEPVVQPAIENRLRALLIKVGPPTDPAGAFARANFIMQSATKPEDFLEARKHFLFAAERGHGQAQLNLARIYLEGRGVDKDETEAFNWLIKAAGQNEPHSGCRVADMYASGQGVEKNELEALKWFQREATNGCANSQFKVGRYYEYHGKPVEALGWFRQAATNGLVLAQSTLGERLTDGFTVKLDYEEAYLWYGLASENGDRVAALSARRTRNKLDPSRIEAVDREISRLLRQSRAAQPHH